MSFGHAGTIVEGVEDTATEKIARLEGRRDPRRERIDQIPTVVKEKLGVLADGRSEQSLHRRRGRRECPRRRGPGGETRRSLPGRHLQERDGRVEVVDDNVDGCVLCRLCLEAAPRAPCTSRSSTTAPSSRRASTPGGAGRRRERATFTPGWATQLLLTAIVTGTGLRSRGITVCITGSPDQHGSSPR